MRHVIEERDCAILQTLLLEKPGGSLLHAGGGNRCERLSLPAFESMDGGCSNLQRQDSPAGHQGASNGEHSYDHVVDNQEHICEVHDRGIFGSDLALSEYGPVPSPAFGCQTRSIDINLATRRRRWAYNAGQEISVFVGCEQAECVIRR